MSLLVYEVYSTTVLRGLSSPHFDAVDMEVEHHLPVLYKCLQSIHFHCLVACHRCLDKCLCLENRTSQDDPLGLMRYRLFLRFEFDAVVVFDFS